MRASSILQLLQFFVFSLLVTPAGAQEIVVNEFLSSNDNMVADPAGEYDDCIELYNTTDDTINLLGYYLSDDSSFTTKWPFPDTSIAPFGFLVVWADDQITQQGLHTNFGLSRSGESVIIVSPQLTIVDRIDYPEQSTNVSYGRYPDGTGEFRYMYPTIGFGNLRVSVNGPKFQDAIKIYPNPATDVLHVSGKERNIQFRLYDTIGNTLIARQIDRIAHIDLTHLGPGFYFVGLNDSVSKLVIQ